MKQTSYGQMGTHFAVVVYRSRFLFSTRKFVEINRPLLKFTTGISLIQRGMKIVCPNVKKEVKPVYELLFLLNSDSLSFHIGLR